jgi:hypothetical protein
MICEDDEGFDIEFAISWGCVLVLLALVAVWAVAIGATARLLGVI